MVTTSNPAPVGDIFTSDPRVAKLTFTGSTAVGRVLAAKAASNLQRVSVELGGHAPFIVFPDADPVHAAKGAAALKFLNAGQACISPNRLYVPSSLADLFQETLCSRVERLQTGNGLHDGVGVGPLINEVAVAKVETQVEDARSKGAGIPVGGMRLVDGEHRNGHFYAPTVLTDIKPEMKIYREETFGPVAPVITYEDPEQVIEMANDTNYGLAAYVYTKEIGVAMRAFEGLRFGIIGINDVNPTSASVPFGGMGDSGIGREGGHEGIAEYLETKTGGFAI
jgi:succinate-semialdehyde dehydrogenase/glutarate-semialdehyde dehydrogenase